jgi:hypothetical protein
MVHMPGLRGGPGEYWQALPAGSITDTSSGKEEGNELQVKTAAAYAAAASVLPLHHGPPCL